MKLTAEDRARMRTHYTQAVITARSLGSSTWDAQAVLDLLDDHEAQGVVAVEAEVMKRWSATLNELQPPKECPFCGPDDHPCSGCMDLARTAGTLDSMRKDIAALLGDP